MAAQQRTRPRAARIDPVDAVLEKAVARCRNQLEAKRNECSEVESNRASRDYRLSLVTEGNEIILQAAILLAEIMIEES